MLAAAYLRYSTHNQSELSIAAQHRAIKEYCARQGIELFAIPYVDEARSGTNTNRPGYQKLIADARKGLFQAVIVYDVTRSNRDVGDWFQFRKDMAEHGVQVLSVTNSLGAPDDPDAFLGELLAVGIGQHAVMVSRQKSIAGKAIRAERGLFMGGIPPLGYDVVDGKYVINPREAEAVLLAFTMYAEGKSYNQIVQAIADLGVTGKQGVPICANTLHYIFKNQRYAGTFIWGEYTMRHMHKWVGTKNETPTALIEGGIPAIVPLPIFNAVQDRMQNNKYMNHGTRRQYLLSGLIRCGLCGAPMAGHTSVTKGTEYSSYMCLTKQRQHTCKSKNVHCYQLETYIVDMLIRRVLNENVLQLVAQKLMEISAEDHSDMEDQTVQQLADISRKITNLLSALEAGQASELIFSRLTDLQAQKKALEARLALFRSERMELPPVDAIIDEIRSDIEKINLSTEGLPALIRKYISQVTVFDDHIEVTISVNHIVNMHKKRCIPSEIVGIHRGSPGKVFNLYTISFSRTAIA